ncbi:hypothetical protein PT974_06816 [Cladobotryum mycophilum]|uniref:N-acetyltransferase domain-containing protein n=1 Tax=Cladobotryum mycophilum TaxID=491253 RepID=A0ABR0SMJ3_9HYPO
MTFILSDVDTSEAESITRIIEVPAMQNGPLYQTMFPQSDTITEAQKEEITRWYTEMLEEALDDRWESFLKACPGDGTPAGFCGWTIVQQNPAAQVASTNSQAQGPPKQERRKREFWLPETLDGDAWVAVSKVLRTERNRVLKDLDNVCRKLINTTASRQPPDSLPNLGLTFMAVNPHHQRQGIGSLMMQHICEETDRHGRCAYVLAAPEGVPLYTKFGFETVGFVETPKGTITSMLRPAR